MDPTNANAVAGPSRLPAHGVEPTPPPPAPVPAPTAPDTTSTTTTTAAAAAEPENSSSSSRGPKIVPTVLDPDGLRVVPNLFELCQVDDLISLIASMLDRLIQHNDRIPLTPSSLTRFHSRAPPSINVKDYLVRIARYTNVEPCCLLILLPYVDKVCARMTTFTISSLTVHRFIITGVSVGSKALSDSFCTNGRYARVGGVSIAEMNLLEKELCEAIDWRLTTTGTVLAHYYTSLVTSHPQYRLASPLPTPATPTTTSARAAAAAPVRSSSTSSSSCAEDLSSAAHATTPNGIASPPTTSSPNTSSRGVHSTTAPTPMDQDGSSSSPLQPVVQSTTPSSVATTTTAASSSVPASLSSLTSSPVDSTSVAAPSRVLLPQGLARHLLNERSASVSAASALADDSSNPHSTSSPIQHHPVVGPSPALIPAPTDKRRKATASNLPSPVRSAAMSLGDQPQPHHLGGTVGGVASELQQRLSASTNAPSSSSSSSSTVDGQRRTRNDRMAVDDENVGDSDDGNDEEEADDTGGETGSPNHDFPEGSPMDSNMSSAEAASAPASTSSSPDMMSPTGRVEQVPETATIPGKRNASQSPYQTSPAQSSQRSRKILMSSS